jgi:outer membrane scaffolding protein for murein synthesis (MipA/OmpV family)
VLGAGLACCLVLYAVALAPPCRAEEPRGTAEPWIVTIGGWGTLEPTFEGARTMKPAGRPIFSFRSAGSKDWLVLPNDGFDFELIETDNFRAGPVANWNWVRASNSIAPRGFRPIGSVDLSVEAGVFAEYWPMEWIRTRAELRDSVWGGNGWIADLTSDLVWRTGTGWTITGGPRLSLADTSFMRTYYGVSPEQSLATGLPTYLPRAGWRSVGLGQSVKYDWNPSWSTMAFVEYRHLSGPAGDSPVIDVGGTREQFTVGLGFSYNFTFSR